MAAKDGPTPANPLGRVKLPNFVVNHFEPGEPHLDFKGLIGREFGLLNARTTKEDFETTGCGPADEPWVRFTRYDHFALALSGGGIRSATFNLGLLQGLQRNGVLAKVDYLSTVSGGGYVGGFWTAWLDRHKGTEEIFPPIAPYLNDEEAEPGANACNSSGPRAQVHEMRESAEFRHLREFSRFLMPRIGYMKDETWGGIITVLGGLIPSLLAATAVVVLMIYAWFGLILILIDRQVKGEVFLSAALIFLVTAIFQLWWESGWRVRDKAGDSAGKGGWYYSLLIVTALATGAFWYLWHEALAKGNAAHWLTGARENRAEINSVGGSTFHVHLVPLGPAAAWLFASIVMLANRFFCSRFFRDKNVVPVTAAMDRCAYRCLALAVAWICGFALWEFGRWLHGAPKSGSVVASGPVVFGGLFLWLRNWLVAPIKETHGSRLIDKMVVVIKPLVPQLLAAAAVVSYCLVWVVIVQRWGLRPSKELPTVIAENLVPLVVGTSVGIILITLWVFNPARIGMHDFYRDRISRCFLGAAKEGKAEDNRATTEQKDDDLFMCGLQSERIEPKGPTFRQIRGPIHLVCCAANNLAGDTLSSLYRGCRSAVLSLHGISLGRFTARLPELRLSSALTASGAAFNSQMGRVSMRLGPAVAVVMSALNCRLGLWVPHPLNPLREHFWFPGRFFFYEMFGHTKCDQDASTLKGYGERFRDSKLRVGSRLRGGLRSSEHLHLSDGGHFENLGLYELIRRHCRYIIVSDASADPQVAFDDLANALRCVREDFGVEIEIDVGPLYPTGEANRSTQHAVVGTIHYDGFSGSDKGTILYFKPTLTGDEPPDVVQYQTRNLAFPHESTGDQFYDEAQWESYRRLGEHEANVVLRFLQTPSTANTSAVENLFLGATQRWHPAPQGHEEAFLRLTERFSKLEAEVRDHAPASLRCEFFPEAAAAGLTDLVPAKREDELKVIYFVMLAAQVMEDAWVGCDLDTYWSHPLNRGWMTYLERWASTPSFRRWWPILRPIYSVGFADFVKQRFNLRLVDASGRELEKGLEGARLELNGEFKDRSELLTGMACRLWTDRYGEFPNGEYGTLEYRLRLESFPRSGNGSRPASIQVGFLLYRKVSEHVISWESSHLFVCPTLVGAGIVARFLDAVIAWFDKKGFKELRVNLPEHGKRADPGPRQERVLDINFYKSRGFAYDKLEGDRELLRLSKSLTDNKVSSRTEKKV